MFKLENGIADWRRRMHASGILEDEVLDELEGHLREDIGQRMQRGADAETAFRLATQSLGEADVLRGEFECSRVGTAGLRERLKSVVLALAGIPNSTVATAGASALVPLLEPRWATYGRAIFFCVPAILLWIFSVLFLIPKVNHFAQLAGFAGFKLVWLMTWMTENWLVLGSAMAGMIVLLEWRSARWPRYRRAVLGAGAFALNALVMATITLLTISVIVTAVEVARSLRG